VGEPRLIAPLHVHHGDDEAWYVLEGVVCVRAGDRVIEAGAGGSVLVPKGTVHTYWNAGPGPLRYLLIMTRNIYELIGAIHALPKRTPENLQAAFRQHNSEIMFS
jgi:quercetin dioxygenase-like cupin family protein